MDDMSTLTAATIKQRARELGADLVGIADGTLMEDVPAPRDVAIKPSAVTDYDGDRVIVLARRLFTGTNRLTRWDERHKYYNDELALTSLEETALELVLWLEDHGVPGLIVPSTHVDPWRYSGDPDQHLEPMLSLNYAAVEAGMGTLGLNLQLLTPEYGPRVVLSAVLCSAQVDCDRPIERALCLGPSCGRCLKSCPGDVIGHYDRDWVGCDRFRSPHGFAQLTEFLTDVFDEHDAARKAELVRSRESFELWSSILRGSGVVTGCRRCAEVCPVGADYAAVSEPQDRIAENTAAKERRLGEMIEAEQQAALPMSYVERRHWIGDLDGASGGDERPAAARAGVATASHDARYPGDGPLAIGLSSSLAWARRSPFFSQKLAAAGIEEDDDVTWAQWRTIPPTTKEELRALDSFQDAVVIADRTDVVEFWRSGGVTGAPLYYPRTRADLDHALESFARGLRLVGVAPEDTVMCSLPLGIHPAGQFLARAAESIGAAVIWAGAGNQLPSVGQIELLRRLHVTVWIGMASFGLHLAHLAEAEGHALTSSDVRLLVTTAEPVSTRKRELLGRLWGGASVRDMFGMTEVTMLGAECGRRPGLHMWTESSFCEVLDPDTLEPVDPGEVGLLCVTAKATGSATPFIRWLSGDIVRLEFGCDCEHDAYPRLIHSGRTTGFFKVKGVNIDHTECEESLYGVESLRDFRVSVTPDDRLLAEIETGKGTELETVAQIRALFQRQFGIRADVETVARGTIAKAVGDQIKAQRFIDQRAKAAD